MALLVLLEEEVLGPGMETSWAFLLQNNFLFWQVGQSSSYEIILDYCNMMNVRFLQHL